MANLYEIESQIAALIDSETGEVKDYEAFEVLQMERSAKIENIALLIKNLESDAEAFKKEKQSFADKQSKAESIAKRLREMLTKSLSGQKFSTHRVSLSFKKSESVIIADINKLPKNYIKIQEPIADKNAIKADLKSGKEVAGAYLQENMNLLIK